MTKLLQAINAQAQLAQFELHGEQGEQIAQFLQLLHSWGSRIRLTGDHSPAQVVHRQLPDAFYLAKELARQTPSERGEDAIDVGCGAGLPSIPLLVLRPRLALTLLEPNHRRCAFMRTALYELGLAATISNTRLESAGNLAFETVWSRATWSPEQWLGRATPLTKQGGLVFCFAVRPADLPLRPPAGLIVEGQTSYRLSDGTPRLLARYRRVPSTDVVDG